jgi:hypothetical protein
MKTFHKLIWVALLALTPPAQACSPSGHVFVALAALEQLKRSDHPAAKRLAAILERHHWVVCHGAEGPDWVQSTRNYESSHYKVLFHVSYESPQAFDARAAQPVFSALLRDSYRLHYGLTPEDRARLKPQLYLEPAADQREVGLAFAAGYISHLLADYFCHRPALTWWEKDGVLQEATKRARPGESYGPIQSVYATFLWQSHAAQYGLAADLRERFVKEVDAHQQDNGVLPFCALACSRQFYAGWGIDNAKFVAPEHYEACARPIRSSPDLRRCLDRDREEMEAIFRETKRSFEENLRLGAELTPWKQVYDDVIALVAQAWATAAPIVLEECREN